MNIHGWIFRTFRTRRGCMDWVSVQCSCQSFTFGVPFVGLGKFYTVDSPKEIGPLASSPRKQKCFFPCQGKKNNFFPWQGKKKPHPWYLQMLCLTQVFVEPRLKKMAWISKFVRPCNKMDLHPRNVFFIRETAVCLVFPGYYGFFPVFDSTQT